MWIRRRNEETIINTIVTQSDTTDRKLSEPGGKQTAAEDISSSATATLQKSNDIIGPGIQGSGGIRKTSKGQRSSEK